MDNVTKLVLSNVKLQYEKEQLEQELNLIKAKLKASGGDFRQCPSKIGSEPNCYNHNCSSCWLEFFTNPKYKLHKECE